MTENVPVADSSESCSDYAIFPSNANEKVYIILWSYYDNSSFGVMRVYDDKVRAEQDMQLLADNSASRNYQLVELLITK